MRCWWSSPMCVVMFASFLPESLPGFEQVAAEFDAGRAGSALGLGSGLKGFSIVPSI